MQAGSSGYATWRRSLASAVSGSGFWVVGSAAPYLPGSAGAPPGRDLPPSLRSGGQSGWVHAAPTHRPPGTRSALSPTKWGKGPPRSGVGGKMGNGVSFAPTFPPRFAQGDKAQGAGSGGQRTSVHPGPITHHSPPRTTAVGPSGGQALWNSSPR